MIGNGNSRIDSMKPRKTSSILDELLEQRGVHQFRPIEYERNDSPLRFACHGCIWHEAIVMQSTNKRSKRWKPIAQFRPRSMVMTLIPNSLVQCTPLSPSGYFWGRRTHGHWYKSHCIMTHGYRSIRTDCEFKNSTKNKIMCKFILIGFGRTMREGMRAAISKMPDEQYRVTRHYNKCHTVDGSRNFIRFIVRCWWFKSY